MDKNPLNLVVGIFCFYPVTFRGINPQGLLFLKKGSTENVKAV
jgi:hypothetical protein